MWAVSLFFSFVSEQGCGTKGAWQDQIGVHFTGYTSEVRSLSGPSEDGGREG